MMIALFSFLQMKKGTLPTSRMWMDIRLASVVDMLPIDNGVGHKNDNRILQWVRKPYNLPHRCTQVSAKTKHKKYRFQVREAVLRNSGLGTHGIQQAEVVQVVAAGDIKEVWRRAMQLSYTSTRYEKAKLSHERNTDKHSLEVVGIPKQAADKEDKYLVYKINNSQFNREPDYVLKSSASMAQLAINMDLDGPELQGEVTYFDSSHLQCVNYKTHEVFVYHPAM